MYSNVFARPAIFFDLLHLGLGDILRYKDDFLNDEILLVSPLFFYVLLIFFQKYDFFLILKKIYSSVISSPVTITIGTRNFNVNIFFKNTIFETTVDIVNR